MKLKFALTSLCATIATPSLAAPILWISDSQANLATVDVATGIGTVIGNSGVALTDIAFDSSGTLFGVSFNTLYRVNTSNASLTTVGSLGIGGANALVFGSNGTLYAAANNTTGLYSVNTLTGAATLLGDTGFVSSGDLAFVGNSLFLAAETGASDSLVSVGLGPVSGGLVGSFGVNDVFGMARAENGVLYGVTGNSIRSINTATGASTFVITYNYAGRGQAFGTSFFLEAQQGVPEPATWAMMLLGFGAIGFAMRRRRQPAARCQFAS